jgi:phosphopantetheinyl transferase (holo-ACP synthase)
MLISLKSFITVSGEAGKRLETGVAKQFHLSISHSGGVTVAVVILDD